MKLYYFNPNDYDMEYFVMSDCEENAIKSLNEHLIKEFENSVLKTEKDKPSQWGDWSFRGYTIEVYEANQVIESEIS